MSRECAACGTRLAEVGRLYHVRGLTFCSRECVPSRWRLRRCGHPAGEEFTTWHRGERRCRLCVLQEEQGGRKRAAG